MPAAEKHHGGRNPPRNPLTRLAGPVLLLLIVIGFFWKLVLTKQYTWLEGSDISYQVLPWLQFQAGEWHAGRFPLWDPYLWAGQPLLAQAQPGAAYPLNWLLFLLPLRDGWLRQSYLHWYFVVIHCMAALFCYLLCRDLRRSRSASILAGSAFALGGYIGTTDWPQMLNGAVWAPLVFLFLLRAFRGEKPLLSSALAGAFLGVSLLSGHHQIPTYIALAAGGVFIYQLLHGGRWNWSVVRLAAAFGLFLFLISAMQTLPAYEYGTLSRRWVGAEEPIGWKDRVPYSIHREYSLNPLSLLGIVIPGIHRHSDPYVGVIALTLAALGVLVGWRRPSVPLFSAVAAGGLLFSLGNNSVLHGIAYAVIPFVEKARSPSMAIFIFHFGVAVLIAFGIDTLVDSRESPAVRKAASVAGIFGALIFVILVALVLGRREGFDVDERAAVTAGVAIAGAAILLARNSGHLTPPATATALLVLMLTEWGNVSGYLLPHEADRNMRQNLIKMSQDNEIVEFLRSEEKPFRIEIDESEIAYNFGDWHGIDVFGGYLASMTSNLVRLDKHIERTRMLFGVKYSLGRKAANPKQQEVFRGGRGMNVYLNPDAFPRVWSVHEVAEVKSDGEMRALLSSNTFDLRSKAFIQRPIPELESCAEPDDIRLLERGTRQVVISAIMACRGMVILSDIYYPGWYAKVDGKDAQIHEVYGAIRGVVVDEGSHLIEMRFSPSSFYLGTALTISGTLALAGWVFIGRRRRRRQLA